MPLTAPYDFAVFGLEFSGNGHSKRKFSSLGLTKDFDIKAISDETVVQYDVHTTHLWGFSIWTVESI